MTVQILFYCVALVCLADSARILGMIPTPAFSHQGFFQPLWKELAARGHEITLITTDPIQEEVSGNLKQIDISIAYKALQLTKEEEKKFMEANKINMFRAIANKSYDIWKDVYSHKEVKNLFHNKSIEFDLLMLECVFVGSHFYMHRFNAPTICLASQDANQDSHEAMGNPTHQVLYPSYLLPFHEAKTFVQRLTSLGVASLMRWYVDHIITPHMHKVISEVLEEDYPPPPGDYDMMFINANPLFNTIRPFTPATISLGGGLHVEKVEKLPKDLQNFLDNAKEGVIYFSLGSGVKSSVLKEDLRKEISETFKQLPYKILWKFEDDEMVDKPSNVMIAKWLPQQAVLKHKNIKLFITQGGAQSVEEAISFKVPMIIIPFIVDQFSIAQRIEENEIGLTLKHETLTREEFKKAILNVLSNEKYRKRVAEMAAIIQDQPMKPLERAVWWTEYVIRHKGAKHLRGPQIPSWQYYYLDVLAFILALVAIVVFVILKCIKLLCRFLRKCISCSKRNARNVKTEKKNI